MGCANIPSKVQQQAQLNGSDAELMSSKSLGVIERSRILYPLFAMPEVYNFSGTVFVLAVSWAGAGL